LFNVVGIALSRRGRSRARRDPRVGNRGPARAGLILNSVGLAIWIVFLLVIAWVASSI
jgi:hypothetical protein